MRQKRAGVRLVVLEVGETNPPRNPHRFLCGRHRLDGKRIRHPCHFVLGVFSGVAGSTVGLKPSRERAIASDVLGVSEATKGVGATARLEHDVHMGVRHIDREVRGGRMFHNGPWLQKHVLNRLSVDAVPRHDPKPNNNAEGLSPF